MINRIYKTTVVMICAGCMGFAGCQAGALTEEINSLVQSTIVDVGTILIESAVDNTFNNDN